MQPPRSDVATLPGIVQASYAMPDAHWGYGFPIGGVAAFDRGGGVPISRPAGRTESTDRLWRHSTGEVLYGTV
ncbi:MAG: hypothetical protein EWM72_00757 [Nitrospira sp.]|nr:MAG: hypothetical protein EWM72_00757 [Nitrospira sp.]